MIIILKNNTPKSEIDKLIATIESIGGISTNTIVGEHSVIFAGNNEVLTLSHSAESRDLFGTGAIRAALFIADKPAGFYTMSDVIAEIL